MRFEARELLKNVKCYYEEDKGYRELAERIVIDVNGKRYSLSEYYKDSENEAPFAICVSNGSVYVVADTWIRLPLTLVHGFKLYKYDAEKLALVHEDHTAYSFASASSQLGMADDIAREHGIDVDYVLCARYGNSDVKALVVTRDRKLVAINASL